MCVNNNTSLPLTGLIILSPAITAQYLLLSPLPGPESQSYQAETGTKTAVPRFLLSSVPTPTAHQSLKNPLLVLVLTSERPARAHNPNSF